MKRIKVTCLILLLSTWVSCDRGNSPSHSPPTQPHLPTPAYPSVDEFPSWSPDGAGIIYHHAGITEIRSDGSYLINPDSTGLWMMNADGGDPHQIVRTFDATPDWSPDGKWIVFESGAQIFKVPIAADSAEVSQMQQLTSVGRNFFPTWSPSGGWIAYDRSLADASGLGGIWMMKEDGSQKRWVFGAGYPTWYPDGQSILGVKGTSSTSIWTRFVRYYPFQAVPAETLSALAGNDNRYPRFSPDGTKIAFDSTGPDWGIWIMNADGSNLHRLTAGLEPSWSPDGKTIAFIGSQAGTINDNGTVWVVDIDGTNLRQLTHGPR